jgi:hypothetical protein
VTVVTTTPHECASGAPGAYTTGAVSATISRMSDEKRSWLRGAMDKLEDKIESQKAQHAARAAEAGNLVVQKSFGISAVAVYDGGFVRVSKLLGGRNLAPGTAFERLRSIKYLEQREGDLSLTIATDRQVHTLKAKREMLSANDKAGMALEAAGNAVLDSLRSSAPAAPQPDLAEQIKKLADLHESGILTDEEFNAKKTNLLDRM